MGNYFGIGLRSEFVAARLQALLERARVFDNAIVNHRDITFAVDVRMRVALVGNAMRRPACMSDAEIALDRISRQRALELGDLPGSLAGLDAFAVHHRDTCRVVPAVLHALQPLEEEGRCAFHSDIADYTAHKIFG